MVSCTEGRGPLPRMESASTLTLDFQPPQPVFQKPEALASLGSLVDMQGFGPHRIRPAKSESAFQQDPQPVGGSAFLLYVQLEARPLSFLEALGRLHHLQQERLGHLPGPRQLLQGQRNQITGFNMLRTVLFLILHELTFPQAPELNVDSDGAVNTMRWPAGLGQAGRGAFRLEGDNGRGDLNNNSGRDPGPVDTTSPGKTHLE
ncbi:uncharacterized protein LOC123385954 isoform X2 [Felis catus]|uniref:uncharacterized protein LOC123385954 isoform X2 n=1 Tax=Felis catus TaxID=9685 RepID=UPI001D1A1A74|nr:uncharacterized protein LOC123385954 isoform X2 [Felis catus]